MLVPGAILGADLVRLTCVCFFVVNVVVVSELSVSREFDSTQA